MEFNLEPHFSLNFEMIAKTKKYSAIVRLLANDMMNIGYVNVGDFIGSMTDSEIDRYTTGVDDDDQLVIEELLLMGEMLAIGEGCDHSKTDADFGNRMDQLVILMTVESLYRKGLVKVYRENYSFHEDAKDKTIVEKLQ